MDRLAEVIRRIGTQKQEQDSNADAMRQAAEMARRITGRAMSPLMPGSTGKIAASIDADPKMGPAIEEEPQSLSDEFWNAIGRIPGQTAEAGAGLLGQLTGDKDIMQGAEDIAKLTRRDYPSTAPNKTLTEMTPSDLVRTVVAEGPAVAASSVGAALIGGPAAAVARPLSVALARYGKAGKALRMLGGSRNVAAGAGGIGGGVALETGAIGQEHFAKTGEVAPTSDVLKWAGPAGALEGMTPAALLAFMTRKIGATAAMRAAKAGTLRQIAKDYAKGSAGEGLTEYPQTMIEEMGGKNLEGMPASEAITSTITDPKAHERAALSGIIGMAGGAGTGSVEALSRYRDSRRESIPAEPPAAPTTPTDLTTINEPPAATGQEPPPTTPDEPPAATVDVKEAAAIRQMLTMAGIAEQNHDAFLSREMGQPVTAESLTLPQAETVVDGLTSILAEGKTLEDTDEIARVQQSGDMLGAIERARSAARGMAQAAPAPVAPTVPAAMTTPPPPAAAMAPAALPAPVAPVQVPPIMPFQGPQSQALATVAPQPEPAAPVAPVTRTVTPEVVPQARPPMTTDLIRAAIEKARARVPKALPAPAQERTQPAPEPAPAPAATEPRSEATPPAPAPAPVAKAEPVQAPAPAPASDPEPRANNANVWTVEQIGKEYEAAGLPVGKNAVNLHKTISSGNFSDSLWTGNRTSRKIFEKITGIKLPTTIAGTKKLLEDEKAAGRSLWRKPNPAATQGANPEPNPAEAAAPKPVDKEPKPDTVQTKEKPTNDNIESRNEPAVSQPDRIRPGVPAGAGAREDEGRKPAGVPAGRNEAGDRKAPEAEGIRAQPLGGEGDRAERDDRSAERPSGKHADAKPGKADQGVDRNPTPAEKREVGPDEKNHVITSADEVFKGGKVGRAAANIEAIGVLRQVQKDNRNATPEEKKVLARFSGWGALSEEVFPVELVSLADRTEVKDIENGRVPDSKLPSWWSPDQRAKYRRWESKYGSKLHPRLGGMMSRSEWDAAAASTTNAHYTDIGVAKAMWDIANRLGFRGGVVLEPASGTGNFIGTMPADVADKSSVIGVELDEITGAIFKALYPQAETNITGFQDAKIPSNSVDLVISNVPFGKFPIADGKKPYSGWSIHNYFFGRSMDLLRPGGLMISITSAWTANSAKNKTVREYLDGKADLIGIIRLPGSAFEKNAGTSVVTDIIILRKKSDTPMTTPAADWLSSRTVTLPKDGGGKGEANINEYFVAHPEMVVGEQKLGRGLHSEDEYMIDFDGDVGAEVSKRLTYLPENIQVSSGPKVAVSEKASAQAKDGTFQLDSKGSVVYIEEGRNEPLEVKEFKKTKDGKLIIGGVVTKSSRLTEEQVRQQIKDYIGVRAMARELFDAQRNGGLGDDDVKTKRDKLNSEYDYYVKKFGPFNEVPGQHPLWDDIEFPTMLALEDEETTKNGTTWKKAEVFTKRTEFPTVVPSSASNIPDAMNLSVSFFGRIDLTYMAKILGMPRDDLQKKMLDDGHVFEDPNTGSMVPAQEYLTGFVKKKLSDAEEAGDKFKGNVEALKKVVGQDKAQADIDMNAGASWIPASVYSSFIREVLDSNAEVTLEKSDEDADSFKFDVSYNGPASIKDRQMGVTTVGGTVHKTAAEIFEKILNKSDLTVRVDMGDGKKVVDPDLTTRAHAVKQVLTEEFSKWAKKSEAAMPAVKAFNELFTGYIPEQGFVPADVLEASKLAEDERIDGRKLTDAEKKMKERVFFPGASHGITLRPHQIKAVYRSLRKNTLLAHSVGTGKTFTLITTAKEMKRLGIANKPLIVAHNATLEQFANSANKLYPSARVLVVSKKDRTPENRRRILARIKTGNWDMVIIPQSFYNMVSVSSAKQAEVVGEHIADLEAAISETKEPKNRKKLEAEKAKLQAKLKELSEAGAKDTAIDFEDLGTDALLVDEAHAYKRGFFTTKLKNVRGIDKASSARALGTEMKLKSLADRVGPARNVVFATGTPISNTLAEAWTFVRYLRPDILKAMNISAFDDFVSTFTAEVSTFEVNDSGTPKQQTYLSSYSNLGQFIPMVRGVFDIVMQEDLRLKEMVKVRGGGPKMVDVPRSQELTDFIEYIRTIRKAWDELPGKDKMESSSVPLVAQTVLRKASIDVRLVDPSAPEPKVSKVRKAAENIKRLYDENSKIKGTQFVFCDLFRDNPDDPRFNVFNELKRLLVEKGIPAAEIADIYEVGDNDEKRSALFDKVRRGDVRVIMGSSEKVGVGVDVAERMVAAHHIDVPRRPMDWEQRNGRVIRQGNMNAEADIFIYGTKNTFDTRAFEIMQRKLKFIKQALSGKLSDDSYVDDDDEGTMSFAELSAMLSGNTAIIEMFDAQKKLSFLMIERDTANNAVRAAKKQIEDSKEIERLHSWNMSRAKEKDERTAKMQALREDFTDKIEFLRIGRDVIENKPAAIKAALEELFDAYNKDPNGVSVRVQVKGGFEIVARSSEGMIVTDIEVDGITAMSSQLQRNRGFVNAIAWMIEKNGPSSAVAFQEDYLANAKKKKTQAEKLISETEFKKEDELKATQQKVGELRAKIEEQAKNNPAVIPDMEWFNPSRLPNSLVSLAGSVKDRQNREAPSDRRGSFSLRPARGGSGPSLSAVLRPYVEFARSAIDAGKTFVQYLADAIRKFGEAARRYLSEAWNVAKSPGYDRRGGIRFRGTLADAAAAARREKMPESEGKAFDKGVTAGRKETNKVAKEAIKTVTAPIAPLKREVKKLSRQLRELRDRVKSEKIMSAETKRALIKYAFSLPEKVRAAFVAKIAKASTADQGLKVIAAMTAAARKRDLAVTMAAIKKQIAKVQIKKVRPEFKTMLDKVLKITDDAITDAKADPSKVAESIAAVVKGYIDGRPADFVPMGQDTINEIMAGILRKKESSAAAAQLRALSGLIGTIVHANRLENRIVVGKALKNLKEVAGEIKTFVSGQPKIEAEPGTDPEKSGLRWYFDEGSLSFEAIIDRLGAAGKKFIYDALNTGYNESLRLFHDGRDSVLEVMKKHGHDPDSRETALWNNETVTVAGQKITRGERMNLVANLMDASTRKEILRAGFVRQDNKTAEAIKLTEAQIQDAITTLPADERAIVNAMRAFLNGELRGSVNKAWVALAGHEKALRTDYWPRIRLTEDKGMNEFFTRHSAGAMLEGLGIFKERSKSNAPVIVGDVFGTYQNHVKKASAFSHLAVPVRNTKMIMGVGGISKATTLQYGKQFDERIKEQLKAVGDMGAPGEGYINALASSFLRNVSTAYLGLNPRSWMKQFGGLFTAMTELSFSDMLEGVKAISATDIYNGFRGNDRVDPLTAAIFKYSPKLRDRYDSSGARLVTPMFGSDKGMINASVSEVRDKMARMREVSMRGLETFDRQITRAIWKGAEAEISRTRPELSGDEKMKAVAARAEQVVARTQNTTSVLDMSGIALESRKSPAWKAAIAFQSQGNAVYNMLRRAIFEFRNGRIDEAELARRIVVGNIGNALASVLVSTLFASVLKGGDSPEEKKARRVPKVLYDLIKENSGMLYGAGVVLNPIVRGTEAVIEGKNLLSTNVNTETVTQGVVNDALSGMLSMFKAAASGSDKFESGKRAGLGKRREYSKEGAAKLAKGIAAGLGVPLFPVTAAADLFYHSDAGKKHQ